MTFDCMVHDALFQRRLKAVEQARKYISDSVHAVICAPPYNTLRIGKLLNSEHNRLNLQDMIQFAQSLSALMDPGARGPMLSLHSSPKLCMSFSLER